MPVSWTILFNLSIPDFKKYKIRNRERKKEWTEARNIIQENLKTPKKNEKEL